MAEVLKYEGQGSREVTFLTATSSGYTKITSSHIGYAAARSDDGTAAIALSAVAKRAILGKIMAVRDDDYVTINTGGFMGLPAGEAMDVASATFLEHLATASGYVFNVTASYALSIGAGNFKKAELIEGASAVAANCTVLI